MIFSTTKLPPRKPRTKVNYRKIYEDHHGVIPVDSNGRTFQIHHIDGDSNNNNIENLIALSIQDHYDIHLRQGDYDACLFIAYDMSLSPNEISALARLNANQQVKNGTHNFLGGVIQSRTQQKRLTNGTHNLSKRKDGSSSSNDRVLNGTHNRLKDTVYCFKNKITGETVTMTQNTFKRTYNLNSGNLSSLITGRIPSVKGWTLNT